MDKIYLKVDGMLSKRCENNVYGVLKSLDGVVRVDVSNIDGSAMVVYDQNRLNEKTIVENINSIGYNASIK